MDQFTIMEAYPTSILHILFSLDFKLGIDRWYNQNDPAITTLRILSLITEESPGEKCITHYCTNCEETSNNIVPGSIYFALCINKREKSVVELIHSHFEPNTILEKTCSMCNKINTTTSKIQVKKYSSFLQLEIKRYSFTKNVTTKNEKHIKFQPQLQVSTGANNETFTLVSVIVHLGVDIQSGHYVCYVKHGDYWWEFNDEHVSKKDWNFVKNQKAYVLLYSKTTEEKIIPRFIKDKTNRITFGIQKLRYFKQLSKPQDLVSMILNLSKASNINPHVVNVRGDGNCCFNAISLSDTRRSVVQLKLLVLNYLKRTNPILRIYLMMLKIVLILLKNNG